MKKEQEEEALHECLLKTCLAGQSGMGGLHTHTHTHTHTNTYVLCVYVHAYISRSTYIFCAILYLQFQQ